MATKEQIKALKIDENVFELVEDTELEYLYILPHLSQEETNA